MGRGERDRLLRSLRGARKEVHEVAVAMAVVVVARAVAVTVAVVVTLAVTVSVAAAVAAMGVAVAVVVVVTAGTAVCVAVAVSVLTSRQQRGALRIAVANAEVRRRRERGGRVRRQNRVRRGVQSVLADGEVSREQEHQQLLHAAARARWSAAIVSTERLKRGGLCHDHLHLRQE